MYVGGYYNNGGSKGFVYKSTDGGLNWSKAWESSSGYYVYSICVDPSNTNNIYFGSSGGLYKSTDSGETFNRVLNNTTYSLRILNNGYVYAGCHNNVYLSKDYGASWSTAGNSDNFTPVKNCLNVDPDNYMLFIGTSGKGVLKLDLPSSSVPVTLSGFTCTVDEIEKNSVVIEWRTESEINNYGFEIERKTDDCQFKKIEFLPGNGTSSIGDEYCYIDKNLSPGKYGYRLKQIDFNGQYEYFDVINITISAPERYILYQNYSNPFNPETKIRYEIPGESYVSLKVYNVMGNEMKTLVSSRKPAGSYIVVWDGKDKNGRTVSSGAYIYRIQTGEFSAVKKMILLR